MDNYWLLVNEGGDSWNSRDILGHLIINEETDWIPRINIILQDGGKFEPFDRFAFEGRYDDWSIDQMLDIVCMIKGMKI